MRSFKTAPYSCRCSCARAGGCRGIKQSMAGYCCMEWSKERNSPARNARESAGDYLESQSTFRILSRKVLLTFCTGLKQLKAKQFHWYISGVKPEFLLNDKFNYSSSALTFSWLYVGIQACKLHIVQRELEFGFLLLHLQVECQSDALRNENKHWAEQAEALWDMRVQYNFICLMPSWRLIFCLFACFLAEISINKCIFQSFQVI